jgi:hypothetical protein
MKVFKMEQLSYLYEDRDLGIYFSDITFISCRVSECLEVWPHKIYSVSDRCVCVYVCVRARARARHVNNNSDNYF